jgi:hypothetical protein
MAFNAKGIVSGYVMRRVFLVVALSRSACLRMRFSDVLSRARLSRSMAICFRPAEAIIKAVPAFLAGALQPLIKPTLGRCPDHVQHFASAYKVLDCGLNDQE